MDSQEKDALFKSKLLEHINKLVSPQADDDFTETVENLNALLISSNYRQIRDVSGQVDLEKLFHHFNVAPKEVFSDHFINAFSMFLEALPANEIFVKYYDSILEGLWSNNNHVVDLWLKRIVKAVFSNEGMLKNVTNSIININPLLRVVIRLLASEDPFIASASHDVLVTASKAYRQEFFSPGILDEFKKLKTLDQPNLKVEKDTLKIRFYEIVVDVSCISQLLLDLMKSSGFLLEITNEFQEKISSDPLVALNMIKLVTDMASHPHGLQFLRTSTSILPSVAKRIEDIDLEDIYGSLLLPGFINFFIRIAEFDLNVLNEYKVVVNRILKLIEDGRTNREFLVLGIDSIAYICRKNEGKVFVGENGGTGVISQISWMIKSGSTELKGRALVALNNMMELRDADPGNKANLITEKWFLQLETAECGLLKFMEISKEPFSELRVPALNFIRILAQNVWGQNRLANESGFLDYLLDRRSENSKDGREAKYEIVRELVMSPFIRLSFTPESILRLRGYFKAGPIEPEASVAFENAS